MQCGIRSPRLPLSGDRGTGKTLPVLLPRRGRRCSFLLGSFGGANGATSVTRCIDFLRAAWRQAQSMNAPISKA